VDLAILDVMLPDMDGFTLCRIIHEKYFFPVIMLTAKIEESDKVNGILLGADDYITKPFRPMELLARVKGQLRRASSYNQAMGVNDNREVYGIHGLVVDADQYVCKLYDEVIELTPTEFAILIYLCRNMNKVVTSEEIFEHYKTVQRLLWEQYVAVSENMDETVAYALAKACFYKAFLLEKYEDALAAFNNETYSAAYYAIQRLEKRFERI
jgi:DNA-binding response OmpR family regulator